MFDCLIMLKGIEYNSSTKGKCASNTNEIVSTNCESEKWDTEVEKDKKSIFRQCDKCGMNLRLNLRL